MAFEKDRMKDYVPVNERIAAFYDKYPDGSLQSEIVELSDKRVVVRATAYRTPEDIRPGVGHAAEAIPGITPFTKNSELAVAETSAWGRAIAALGFEVKRGIATKEDVLSKQHQEAPKMAHTTNTKGGVPMNMYQLARVDEQSGKSSSKVARFKVNGRSGGIMGDEGAQRDYIGGHSDSGGASRFFYSAKASKSDRGVGNTHPTVKPTELMRYLIKLVTPPGGTVLDPFGGSGTTGVAAMREGFNCVLIERDKTYAKIIKKRIAEEAKTVRQTPLI